MCVHVHITQQQYHHPSRTHKRYCILSSNFRDFCKQGTVLFFIAIGIPAKPSPALSIVFEACLVESNFFLYSYICNLEEQFTASAEKDLRDTDDYNVDKNLENK